MARVRFQAMRRSPWDWLASLIIPGWTQLAYLAFWATAFFFLCAICAWVALFFGAPWWAPVLAHVGAALHGVTLIRGYKNRYGNLGVPDPRFAHLERG